MITKKDEKDLKSEIQHIFDSGANEVRVFEMVKTFINSRYKPRFLEPEDCDHSNYRTGHSPFVACICNDCGEEL
jgi:hypothetical protein